MNAVTIRHSRPEDIDAIAAIYAQPNACANTLQLPYAAREEWQERLQGMRPPLAYSLVAELDEEVMGQLSLIRMENARRRLCGRASDRTPATASLSAA